MTLPSSGSLSMADIQAEFGGSNPISLSEYYAGGAYVPSGTTGTNGAVPSSGAISLSHFYGTSASIPDSFAFTAGAKSPGGDNYKGYGDPANLSIGSTTDDTTFAATGTKIIGIYTFESHFVPGSASLNFVVDTAASNTLWNKLTVNGVDFLRSSASFSTNGPGQASPSGYTSSWGWPAPSTSFFVSGTGYTAVFS